MRFNIARVDDEMGCESCTVISFASDSLKPGRGPGIEIAIVKAASLDIGRLLLSRPASGDSRDLAACESAIGG